MLIHEAQEHDSAAICALLQQVDALHAAARSELFRTPQQPFRTPESIQRLLASANDTLFVATKHDRVVGVAWVITRSTPDLPIFAPRRFAVIETRVVDENSRRQGVGRPQMRHIEQWATGLGLQELQLSVHEFNASARAFYAELGYEVIERRLRRFLDRS